MTSATQQPSPMNYAKVTQTTQRISKEQAIVLDITVDATHEEYILALCKVVEPAKIQHTARIVNNRICVYLDSKRTVDQLLENHPKIVVANKSIPIRSYVTRNKRLTLSNVQPFIDDCDLERELTKLNIKIQSPITTLRAGFNDKSLSHIKSFRRQTYILPDDIEKVPTRIKINFDDTDYWVYLNTDNTLCFECKQEGHISKNCPKRLTNNNTHGDDSLAANENNNINYNTQNSTMFPGLPTPSAQMTSLIDGKNKQSLEKSEESLFLKPQSQEVIQRLSNQQSQESPTYGGKRPHSSTTTSVSTATVSVTPTQDDVTDGDSDLESTNSQISNQSEKDVKPRKSKKLKNSNEDNEKIQDTAASWENLENALSNPDKKYPLSYAQVREFFEITKGASNIQEITLRYTKDLMSLIEMLRDIHPSLPNSTLKTRCTKLRKKIEKFHETEKYESGIHLEAMDSSQDNTRIPTLEADSQQK